MPHKILFFLKLPPPITGATLMNQYAAKSDLLKNTFNIRLIAISYAQSVNELGKWQIKKIIKIFQIHYLLIKTLFFFKPQLVYFQITPHHLGFYRDLLYITIIKLFRTKIVYHLHGKGIYEQSKNRFKKVLYQYAFHKTYLICLSPSLANDVKNVFKGPLFIVGNGIPDHCKPLQKEKTSKPTDKVQLLFLSNLLISKGLIDFIEALRLIKNKPFMAHIIGAPADLDAISLRELIDKYELQNKVIYHGPLYDQKKYDKIKQADILVFPTKNDVWGNVILEAMQCGLPVIATKEGAIPEIIDDGLTGFLVEKDQPKQIAEKLEILMENPRLRKKMGKAARKKYEKYYTLEAFERNLLNVFKEICTKLNGGAGV